MICAADYEDRRTSRNWLPALMAAILAAGALCAWWLAVRTDREMREDLLGQTRLVAEALNPKRIKVLSGAEADLASPEYLRLKEQLAVVRAANPKWRYVYLMGRKTDGTIFFFVDVQDNAKEDTPPSQPGDIYEDATAELQNSFITGRTFVEGPVQDEWGEWISALVPLNAPQTGEILAVLGVDISADNWKWTVAVRAVLPVALTALALLAILFIGSLLLERRAHVVGKQPRWMRRLEAALTAASGFVLTLFAAWLAQNADNRNQADTFRVLAENRTALLAEAIRDLRDIELEGLARFYEGSSDVTTEEFRQYAEYLTHNSAVQAWEWIPAVPAADKERFERETGIDGFKIWQRDAFGNRVPAAGREVYYPVFHVTPLEGNRQALGYDLGSEPVRRSAIEESLRTGFATATEPVTLVQETGNQKGMLVFRPVFADAQRQQSRGLVVAVLRLGDTLDAAIPDTLLEKELILGCGNKPSETIAASWTADNPPGNNLIAHRPVLAFGKTFIVAAHTGPEFLRMQPARAGINVFLTGLLLTTALVIVVSVLRSRRQTLEELVRKRTAALRISEEHLSATLRSIGDGVISCDREGRVTSLNRVAEALTGWTTAEAAGQRLEEVFRIIHALTRETAENPVARSLSEGVNVELANHTALVARDGTEHQIADSCAPIRDTSGVITGAVLVFRDVTDEYRRREELRENVARMRAISESAQDAIVIMDPLGNISFWNPAAARIFGYSPDEAVGVNLHALLAPERYHSAYQEAFGHFQKTSKGAAVGQTIELQGLHKSGREISVELSLSAVEHRDGWHAIGIMRDITDRKHAENALRESEERFGQLAEHSRTITWEVDANGLYTYVSHTVTLVLGYVPKELVGKMHFYDLHPEAERDRFKAAAFELFAQKKSFRGFENQVEAKTGQFIWVSTNGVPMLDRDGNLIGYRGNDTDITERKQMQEAIRESEKRLDLATRGTGIGIWDYDVPTGRLDWDDRMFALYGVDRSAFGHRFEDWSKCVEPEALPKALDDFHQALQGDSDFNIEFPIVFPNGGKRWLGGAAVVTRDERGQPLRAVGVNYDITSRKTAEEALVNAHRNLAVILEKAPFGIVIIDRNRIIRRANEAVCKMAGGLPREEIQGRHCGKYLCPAEKNECPILDKGQTVDNSERILRRWDGQTIPILKTVTPITIDGEDLLLETFIDISALKRAEQELLETNRQLEDAIAKANEMAVQAECANMAKSQFIANMSHEIRTPMNGVIGMTGLLLDTELSEDQRRYAEIVKSSGESLLGLINDILDFSKIESKKLELEVLDFDLQSLLDDFAATMALRTHDKGLELFCAADPNVPTMLSGDPGRLRQILTNLAGNAVKFTHKGEVAVRVESVQESGGQKADSCLLRFSVRDTGIGIPANKIGMLFHQFTQVDASTTRLYGGTGLGLAISKQLAEMMGGKIGVQSVEGEGSEFWFTARFGLREEAPQIEKLQPAALAGVRVLIVDDNATSREILFTRLSSWGMRPEEAPDGPSGLQALHRALDENDPFLVAVVDMQMPGMDGEAVGRAVKSDATLTQTQLVMLSSLGVRGDARRFQEMGFSAYATKPIQHEELKGVLSQVLAGNSDGTNRSIATRHTAREARLSFAQHKARILLAEDNITNQQVALGILKKLGLTADAVANGREALDALKVLPYDLVLMDVQMPNMDGLQATRKIRHQKTDHREIPIIAMTAHAMQGDKEKCLEAGMNDYISKPITPQALALALEKWLPKEKTGNRNQETAVRSQKTEKEHHSSSAVFDYSALLERLMDDKELARTVLQGFLEDIPRQIEALQGYLESGDAVGAERQAHTIKGASANVSGETLWALASELEQAGKAGDFDSVKMRMLELCKAFEQFKQAVEENHIFEKGRPSEGGGPK